MTTVFVTHDQDEALSMSDQVVLMHGGVVEQAGTPEDLYGNPGTRFAADFLGAANLLAVNGVSGSRASVGDETVPSPEDFDGEALLMIRQEDIRVDAPEGCDAHLTAVVRSRVFRAASCCSSWTRRDRNFGSSPDLHDRVPGQHGDVVVARREQPDPPEVAMTMQLQSVILFPHTHSHVKAVDDESERQ
ncbi:hypothetical protein P9209_12500 [Prescottella defluvii]|nr:hypothetical protein P9209_12500 [Prescottella defluvii]